MTILTSLRACIALHVSSKPGNGTELRATTGDYKAVFAEAAEWDASVFKFAETRSTGGGLSLAVDMDLGTHTDDKGRVHRIQLNAEPKSGTTWVALIATSILDVTCKKGCTNHKSDHGMDSTRFEKMSSTTMEFIGNKACRTDKNGHDVDCNTKHQLPTIGHDQGFDFTHPPRLTDKDLVQKIRAEKHLFRDNAKYLAVFRDPRMVTISACYHQYWNCPEANRYALSHIEALSQWIDLRHRFWKAFEVVHPNQTMLLFYEDLKSSPVETIIQMSEFFGTPVSLAQAQQIEHDTSLNTMKASGSKVAQGGAKTGKVRSGKACNYKEDLSKDYAKMVTHKMRDALSADLNRKWSC